MRRLPSVFLVVLAIAACSAAAHAERRVALVIGNAAYQYTARLANPANDADDMARALENVGFEVIAAKNVDKRSLEKAMADFGRRAREADAALVYYAGHGIQYQGSNYLMPIDARLEDEYSVNYELTRIDDVLFALSKARGVKILILDACRNNPLGERLSSRGTNRDLAQTRGLARLEAPRGTVVAFATQSDQVAVDGSGRNSPFTGALLREIEEPGIEIAVLFRRVAIDVNQATGGRQLPELSISMSGEFYLNTRDTDIQAWAKLRGSSDRQQLSNFVKEYPNSPLASEVQERLAALERAEKLRLEQAASARAEREQAERVEREQIEKNRVEEARPAGDRTSAATRPPLPPSQAREAREGAGATENPPPERLTSLVPREPVQTLSPQPYAVSGGALVQSIKKELKRLGCYTGRIDDDWASNETKSSVNRFVKYANLSTQPRNPDIEFLNSVRSRPGRVCPLECGTPKIERNGRCVARDKEPAKPPIQPTEVTVRSAAVARADQASVAGTYRTCMGPTSKCYQLHPPDVARTWCIRRPTC